MAKQKVVQYAKNKEKTKQRILNAVSEILKNEGHSALKISHIAKTAGVDRKLIYDYYDSTDNLISTYIKSQDYWDKASENSAEIIEKNQKNHGKSLLKEFLRGQLETMLSNTELQRIITWELYEPQPLLKKHAEKREEQGEVLFKNITDSHFGESATTFRAIQALLISGIYYLSIYNTINGSKFCGIDMTTPEGIKQIENALDLVVDMIYEKKP